MKSPLCTLSIAEKTSGSTLFRAATQIAPLKLGQGYDVREDNPIDLNNFAFDPKSITVSRTDLKPIVRVIDDLSVEEKFQALKIEGELKLNVMMSMPEVNGCGRYFFQERTDSNIVVLHLTSVFQTEIEQVEGKKQIVLDESDLSKDTNVTHIVRHCLWRSSCLLLCIG